MLQDTQAQLDALRTQAKKVRRDLVTARDGIDKDPTFSPQGRMEQKDQHVTKARAQLKELRSSEEKLLSDRAFAINRKLGGYSGSDPAALIAFRDANDRAEALPDPKRARAVLDRALTSGDTVLAAAVMRQAAGRLGWSEVVDRYAEANPTSRADLDELNWVTETQGDTLGRSATYGIIGG